MKNLEIITAENAERIEEIGADLAESYKVAFAGPPWNEVSRCVSDNCIIGLSSLEAGCECPECQAVLSPAYDTNELVESWVTMVREEDALLEVAFTEGLPQRATLARPTNPRELYERKYSDVPEMALVIPRLLPSSFVWIEDTFANRIRVPKGNLRQRGETIGRIASFYGDSTIATRTLAEQIVAATLRDNLASTSVYIGTNGAGREVMNNAFDNPGYKLPGVPDRRTLLVIKNSMRN